MVGWADLLDNWPEVPLSYNVAPSSTIAVFYPGEHAMPTGLAMRWGLVPGWSKNFASRYATFNARLETVAEKATFRSAWKQERRCLIPMAGYYEWQAASAGPASTAERGIKQPFYITDKNVGGLVAAGLYEAWRPDRESLEAAKLSCTMITRPADQGLDTIHGRMPILLTPETARHWLHCELDQTSDFLHQVESPDLVYWPVGRAVGNVRNDDQRLCEPVDI
ncbi:MAG: SOS response-associated peptidase [Gammaproteobacteria bacterium]|nr:SOS response-associated peptidase [Gammaproteobacteria bacterium]